MQSADVHDFLCSTELFRGVAATAVRDLAPELRLAELHDGDVLVRQHDSNQNLYLVESGRLRVSGRTPGQEPRLLFYVESGETICEMALLSDDAASATVAASGETTVFILERDVFDRFSVTHPEATIHIVESLSRRLQSYRLSIAMHLGNLFDTLDPDVLRDLEAELEMFMIYGGEVLYRAGDPGDYLCVVINGRVRTTMADARGAADSVAELGPGELVGEMAVVTNQPRNETVVAVRDSQLARLTRTAYERFVVKHPTWAIQVVTRKLAQRLNDVGTGRMPGKRSVSTVAIIPIDGRVPTGEFCRQLQHALSPSGSTVHLSSARVDEHLGRPGIAQAYERGGRNIRVIEWLASQEIAHRYVLYEGDAFLSPWTERCIRQADQIILLGDGAGDPALSDVETDVLGANEDRYIARQWLVLLHDTSTPSGTKRWLDLRGVERHYHARLSDRASFERLARLLTGQAVGLTLGGGFARGLAHLGVFHAFEELDVAVDVVGSASMGALIGGLWAMGWDREQILREVSDACTNHFGDLTFPFVAFKRGGKFSEKVRAFFGDVQIEDLWVPFFCISANLNRSELKIHTQGSLAKAVLATTRSPGVFPPIVYDGELHIDGGVINNVPVDLMKAFCNHGVTIGVDVSPPHQLQPVRDYGDTLSGWRTFWKRCNPFSKDRLYTPSILLVMIRTLEYSGIAYKNARLTFADIYMYPDVARFRRTDFHLAAEIAQAGYDCARKSLSEYLDRRTPDTASPSRAVSATSQRQFEPAFQSTTTRLV